MGWVVDNKTLIPKSLEILETEHPLFDAFKQVSRGRTKFQLEKFVVGSHDTPEQQYKQIVIELQALYFTYQRSVLEYRKLELEIEKLREENDAIKEIEAQIKELSLQEAHIGLLAAKHEFEDLLKMWQDAPIKYTEQDIEEGQSLYWDLRLMRQAQLEAVGMNEVGFGNLEALRQIGKLDLEQLNVPAEPQGELA